MRTQALKWEVFDGAGGEPRPAPAPAAESGPAGVEPAGAAEPAAEPGAAPEPEAEPVETLLARARGEGRAAGFQEGAAHAEAHGAAELRVILSDLREAIQDAAHARLAEEEAGRKAARRLAEALLSGVAPAFARQGLAAEALRAPHEAGAAEEPGLRIRVAPAQAEAVRAELERAGLSAPVETDPALSELSARLDWGGGEDAVDLGAALEAARRALERHAQAPPQADPEPQRRDAHG
ncbi:MAG: hypothetical protein ACQEUZ_13595 [Pseudomonadota bacterium]